jgi:hypothetical protein
MRNTCLKAVCVAVAFLSFLLFTFLPRPVWACACGCGVFDVGGSGMIPSGAGGTAYLEYDYMDQGRNWHGASSAPLADNDDKRIRSDFYVAGLQYMVNRDWGLEAQVPYTHRDFTTTDDDTGDIVSFRHSAIGDIRLMGIYSGFSPDMSSGITFGVKLPNGDYQFHGFDRDTSIGTGSTDSLLGFYHQDRLTSDNVYSWFAQALWDRPFLTRDGYRPGAEIDAALGVYHKGWTVAKGVKVTPILQLIGSNRLRDGGVNADRDNSGYNRLLLSPGAEIGFGSAKLYGDVEVPVWQQVNGNQLVAPALLKFIVSYSF